MVLTPAGAMIILQWPAAGAPALVLLSGTALVLKITHRPPTQTKEWGGGGIGRRPYEYAGPKKK